METVVVSLFEAEEMLKASVEQTAQALSKLDSLLFVLVSIVSFFLCVNILKYDIKDLMSGILAIWVGLLFAVGGTLKNLLESILFLFGSHPYDVGDKVIIESESLKVIEFGLMSTTFMRNKDSIRMTWPNVVLAGKQIYNVRRSGGMDDLLTLSVGIHTTHVQLEHLKEYLVNYIKVNEFRDLKPMIIMGTAGIYDRNRLDLVMKLIHKVNFTDGLAAMNRKTKFTLKVIEGCAELGIELALKPIVI
jgi:small-conductance mechanosensitive channel